MSVLVLGSANLDLVYDVDRIPAPGETVLARGFAAFPGGKGNNQAVAAARSGADTTFIVALGRDASGDRLAEEARRAGIALLDRRYDAPTGTAVIHVDARGENAIVVDSGANALLTDLTAAETAAIADADVLVLQLETPVPTVVDAVRAARAVATRVVLNAAPCADLPRGLLGGSDVLVVNEHEAAALTGLPAGADERSLLAVLTDRGSAAIVTLGAAGALVGVPGAEPVLVRGHAVEVVDTTGAGDTFVGALAAALDRSGERTPGALVDAAAFATAAAAMSVRSKGAVPSIPMLEAVRAFRAGH